MSAPVPLAAKDRFTSLDVEAVARELEAVRGAWVDRVYDAFSDGFGLLLRPPGARRVEFVAVPGVFAAVLPEPLSHNEELSVRARELRRLLQGSQLAEVHRRAGDRWIELVLRRGDDLDHPLLLSVEWFGAGNVLVARAETLRFVWNPRTFAARTLRVGAPYRPAPGRPDPFQISASELARTLASSEADRVSTLAARLGFGGPVAEELLARAEADGRTAASTDPNGTADRLVRAIVELRAEATADPHGYLYRDGGVPVDVSPYHGRRWDGRPSISFDRFATFSEAAFAYFAPRVRPPDADVARHAEARRRLEGQRDQQRATIEQAEAEAREYRRQADWIFAHLGDRSVEPGAPATGQTADAGSDVNQEPGVEIPPHETPISYAERLYGLARIARARAEGARTALEQTEERLRALDAGPVPEPDTRTAPATGRSRPRWFERFRWFVSGEGFLVLGGRDASTNEQLVRRYLGEHDRYVHADVHGAPTVIVRRGSVDTPPPGDQTMREAGQFGVCFSKVWRAGLASGEAYWVEADQVSRSPPAGEFLARGSFMVYGNRRRLSDLPTELALGTVEYEGELRWVAAPESALRARGQVHALIRPGDDRRRAEAEREWSRALGIDRELLPRLLPPGGFVARRP